MIVVVGLPAYVDEAGGGVSAGGLAVEVAAEARRRGAVVELAGKVGSDGAGDAVVVALGRLGIGHAALLRDPARPTPLLVSDREAAGTADLAEMAGMDSESAVSHLLPEDPNLRPALEAGDVEMALRYLAGPSVVVVADLLSSAALAAAVDGAAFSTAKLVLATARQAPGSQPTSAASEMPELAEMPELPEGATVLEMPPDDDGAFARLLGAYAASLDAGTDPAKAFRDGVLASGWEPSTE
jgi:hypothetical protein